jgi:GNAT superfamily N-acetyltransferase
MKIAALAGADLKNALPDLARLRIEVFRDYPYLYDGSPGYEQDYLSTLTGAKDSIIVAAEDHGRIVGCATGSALEGSHAEFAIPLLHHGFDSGQVFYCGESVLTPTYRGRGLGHAFFDRREEHAKASGYKYGAFCGVVRPEDHALRPATYSPLDAFWEKRGYRKAEGMIAMFQWKDIDQPQETAHPMQFWIRELG